MSTNRSSIIRRIIPTVLAGLLGAAACLTLGIVLAHSRQQPDAHPSLRYASEAAGSRAPTLDPSGAPTWAVPPPGDDGGSATLPFTEPLEGATSATAEAAAVDASAVAQPGDPLYVPQPTPAASRDVDPIDPAASTSDAGTGTEPALGTNDAPPASPLPSPTPLPSPSPDGEHRDGDAPDTSGARGDGDRPGGRRNEAGRDAHPAPGANGSGADGDNGIIFIDPCFELDPPSGDCPGGGMKGTILRLTDPGPFRITRAAVAPQPGIDIAYDLCRARLGADVGTDTVLGIYSSRPATFTITGAITRGSRTDNGDGTATNVDSAANVPRFEVRTADADAAAWQRVLDADRPNGGVITCARIRGLQFGDGVVLTIDGRTDDGMTDRFRAHGHHPGFHLGRPDVLVEPTGPVTTRVLVPIRRDQRAAVYAVAQGGSANCATARRAANGSDAVGRVLGDRIIDRRSELLIDFSLGTPWEDFEEITYQFERLNPTGWYDLCVDWLGSAGSAQRVIESESIPVRPVPVHQVAVDLVGAFHPGIVAPASSGDTSNRPVARDGVVVVPEGPGPPIDVSRITFDVNPVHPAGQEPSFSCHWDGANHPVSGRPSPTNPVPICAGNAGAMGNWANVKTTYFGRQSDWRVPIRMLTCTLSNGVPTELCGDREDVITMRLPGDAGNDAGVVALRFRATAPFTDATTDGDRWLFGPRRAPLPTGAADPISPTAPRLDRAGIRVTAFEQDGPMLRLDWTAPTPVAVAARIESPHPCTRPGLTPIQQWGPPSATEVSLSGRTVIGPLCAGTTYDIGLQVRDDDGHLSHYSSRLSPATTIGPAVSATSNKTRVRIGAAFDFRVHGNPGSNPAFGVTSLGADIVGDPSPLFTGPSLSPGSQVVCRQGRLDDQPPSRVVDVAEPFNVRFGLHYLRLFIPTMEDCPTRYNQLDINQSRYLTGSLNVTSSAPQTQTVHVGSADDTELDVRFRIERA